MYIARQHIGHAGHISAIAKIDTKLHLCLSTACTMLVKRNTTLNHEIFVTLLDEVRKKLIYTLKVVHP